MLLFPLVINAALDLYFVYQDNRRASIDVQREKRHREQRHVAVQRVDDEARPVGGAHAAHVEDPEDDRKRIAQNRDITAPTMIDAASPYPDVLATSLVAGPRDSEVTVSLVAGPDRDATEQTLNSFPRCCIDLPRGRRRAR